MFDEAKLQPEIYASWELDEENLDNDDGESLTIFYVNGKSSLECPQVEVLVGKIKVMCQLDCGAECSLISAELLEELMEEGTEILTLPVSNCVLEAAFGAKSRRIKKQAFLTFKIDGYDYEAVMLVAPKLSMGMILGMEFLKQYCVTIIFVKEYFETNDNHGTKRHSYYATAKEDAIGGKERETDVPYSSASSL
jgi:hypothetical protein